MRLEAVVVSGVTNDPLFAGKGLQLEDRAFVVRRQRLLDKHVLAMLQAISEQFEFRGGGYARQNRIVPVDWNVGQRAVARFLVYRIDRGDEVVAGNHTTLAALNSKPGNHDPHWLPIKVDPFAARSRQS